jgi:hypothetical protein
MKKEVIAANVRTAARIKLTAEKWYNDFKDDPELEDASANDRDELYAVAEQVELGNLEAASKLMHSLDTILKDAIDDEDWNYIEGLPPIRRDVVKFANYPDDEKSLYILQMVGLHLATMTEEQKDQLIASLMKIFKIKPLKVKNVGNRKRNDKKACKRGQG